MLNSDNSPVKPAAIAATTIFCSSSNWRNESSGLPMSAPPKISCSMGEAMPITPMPADTLRQRTAQISQNWGVLCASLR